MTSVPRSCSIAGCERNHWAKGFCSTHYARWRKGRDLEPPIRGSLPKNECQAEGCSLLESCVGYCGMHYARFVSGGDMLAPKRFLQDHCDHPGCPNPHKSLGLCSVHYSRKVASERPPCSYDGCERKSSSYGVCGYHRSREQETGPQCPVVGCTRMTRPQGLCTKHVRYARSYGLTPSQLVNLLEPAVCRICSGTKDLHIDHDHSCCPEASKSCGRCVRGLLCGNCNRGLGCFLTSRICCRGL